MELMEAILNRKSVRKFSHYVVSDDEINKVLLAARQAPSLSNSQAWEFVVVRDRDMVKAVTGTYSQSNPARQCSLASSAIIVACANTRNAGRVKNAKSRKLFLFDLGMAVQNLCLRAHELGLGTVCVGSLDHLACKKILRLPAHIEAVAAIPIGRPAGHQEKPTPRKELKHFTHLNLFGKQYDTLKEQ
jgi:nitroreductase